MEAEQTDILTKQILAGSRLEVTHTGFNRLVMEQIFLQERKKVMRRALLCCFFGLCVMGIIIFLIVQNMQQGLDFSKQLAGNFFQKAWHFIIENQFLILPLILLFIFQQVISRKNKLSSKFLIINF